MAANTYPDPRVSRYINEHTIPVQFNVKDDPGARDRYHSYWTPCTIYQDSDGVEYRRTFGSLGPDQLLAELALGRAFRYLNSSQFDEAVEAFEEALEYTEPVPLRHAENLYFLAVANYRATDEVDELLDGWEEVKAQHPGTEWDSRTRLILD